MAFAGRVRVGRLEVGFLLAGLLVLIAAKTPKDGEHSWFQILLWGSGLVITLVLLAVRDRQGLLRGPTLVSAPQASFPVPAEAVALAGILLLALLLRVPRLESFPPRLHNDEMSCGLAAREFLASPAPSVFSLGWFSCPRFGFFLTSLGFRLFGNSLFGLRMSSVVVGLLSLVGVHFLGRVLFGVGAGLLAALLTATFHWHVHLSRTGFTYVQGLAFSVWALALFALGFATRRRLVFGLAGAVTGLGLQTYFSVRLVPFVLAAWTVVLVWMRFLRARREAEPAGGRPVGVVRVGVVGLSITAAVAVAALAPLLVYYRDHPGDFNLRTRDVFLFSEPVVTHMMGVLRAEGVDGPDPTMVDLLAFQARRVFGLPFRGPDTSLQYGFPWSFIPWPFWIVFAASLAYALRLALDPGFSLLWIFTIGTAVAGGVLTIDPPFSPRLSGLAAALPLFLASFLAAVSSSPAICRRDGWRRGAIALWSLLVFFWSVQNVDLYFLRYPVQEGGSRRDRIVRLLLERPEVGTVVNLFSEPEEFEYESYQFVGRDLKGFNLGIRDRSAGDPKGRDRAGLPDPSREPGPPVPSLVDVLGEAASARRAVLIVAPTSLVAQGHVAPIAGQRFETWNDPFLPGGFSWAVVPSGPP